MVLGIIGAMDVEVEHLIDVMIADKITHRCGMSFHSGKLLGLDVVVVRCGVGKVNAAICAQVLVDEFAVDALLNTGIAGSLDARINIGDMVVSTYAVHHDVHVEVFGYPAGQIPDFEIARFESDKNLRELVVSSLKSEGVSVFEGIVCTGDQFIADPKVKNHIKETFDGLCCEMEGAAIAQTATLNSVPFVIVRAISDKADGSAHMDYPTFEKQAAHNCARLVCQVAAYLKDHQNN